jgi:probable rRNA maturation factor
MKNDALTVDLENLQKDVPLDFYLPFIKTIANTVLKQEDDYASFLNVSFLSDKKMCTLHKRFFHDGSSTDCISLPLDPKDTELRHLGEIFVCPFVAKEYVRKHGGSLYEEITLYIVHALLHLLGYEDYTDRERAHMQKREALAMKSLNKLLQPLVQPYEKSLTGKTPSRVSLKKNSSGLPKQSKKTLLFKGKTLLNKM